MMKANSNSMPDLLPGLVVAALVAALLWLYSLGLGGVFSFDDSNTLEGLLAVNDAPSALLYITTGTTGPLGRPVALASFLINASGYPESASGFLLTNALIHTINVVLVWLALRFVQRIIPDVLPPNRWFAPLTAFFWGTLPVLASTSMMVVQRMTSLSALFMLLGVLAYLWGWARQDRLVPVVLAVLGVGLCTLLAVLTKENGALLPLYLVVLDFTLLAGRERPRTDWPPRLLRWSVLLPSLAVVGYLLFQLPGIGAGYMARPFTLPERLATEPVILWDYLRVAFLPRPLALGPFHDDYPILNFASPLVWLALAAWLLLIGVVFWRRRAFPVFAFAVLWYLAGHLLESSIIPLELYFEHRNYLPILGPVVALAVLAARLPIAPRLQAGLAGLYLTFLVFVLWQTLDIWGKRQHELWARQHPNSPRAVQMVAQTYYEAGYRDESLQLLEDTWTRNPQLSSLGMQALRLRCYRDEPQAFSSLLNALLKTLDDSHFSYLTLHALENTQKLHAAGTCPLITTNDIVALADTLLNNPRFRARAATRQQLYLVKAHALIEQRQPQLAEEQLKLAFSASPNPETLLLLYQTLRNQGDDKAASDLLQRAEAKAPSNPWARKQWLSLLVALRANNASRPSAE